MGQQFAKTSIAKVARQEVDRQEGDLHGRLESNYHRAGRQGFSL